MAATISFRRMPTYVYKFLETGETLEIQQSFADETLTEAVHPRTGATMAVKKVFQPVGVTFKGDGFYKTDSRSSSKAGAASRSESSSADGGSGGTSTTTDGAGSAGETKKTADAPSTTSSTASKSGTTESKPPGGSSGTSSGTTPSSG
jgi:predicted nucleic acid-binding Zn ribbon protein